MYNYTKSISILYKRLGWRNPTQTAYASLLDTDNKTTNSGLYFQDFNRFVTIENIKNTQIDKDISDADFNTYLDNLQKSGINKMLNAVINTDDLIENRTLYPYENDRNSTLANDSKFVGYEIKLAGTKDLAVILNEIIMEFDADESIDVKLYHSSQQTALQTWSISALSSGSVFEAANEVLFYADRSQGYTGGKFYIGYHRDGMTAKAYNREYDRSNIKNCFNMFSIEPFEVAYDGTNLFDIDAIDYTGDTYGMNFDISSVRDYTSLIVENRNIFDRAIGLQVAADCVEQMAKSPRVNFIEKEMKGLLSLELDGAFNDEGKPLSVGLYKELNIEISRLRKILFNKPKGITYTAR